MNTAILPHLIASVILLGVAVAGAGCHDPVASDYEYDPARIAGFVEGDPQWSVTADEGRITVSVMTFGNSCVRKGDLHVMIDPEARAVSVRPYDYRRTAGATCRDVLRSFEHHAAVDLPGGGEWSVVLSGVDRAGDPVTFRRPVSVG